MKHHTSDCTLEAVPPKLQTSAYLYAVPNNPGMHASSNEKQYTAGDQDGLQHLAGHDQDAPEVVTARNQRRPSNLTRWPFLIFYAILIAIIAGVIGGVIGDQIAKSRGTVKAVEAESCTSAEVPDAVATPSATATPASAFASASASATFSASTPSSSVFVRTLGLPSSGCTPTTQQRAFKSVSRYGRKQYTTYCATGWDGDDLVSMSVATPSDCIETCINYNGHRTGSTPACVGAGFVVEWWDQDKAMRDSKVTPFNCFLKGNDTGTARNEKSFEVLSLCLGDACSGALKIGS